MKFLMIRRTYNKRGFTLLLATLLASLLLILGSTIFSVIKKEIILSSLGRDSQFAFYAADTGAECALYWDLRFGAFASTTGFSSATCDGDSLGTITYQGLGIPMTFEFEASGLCTRVSVTKNSSNPRTVIESRGYNTTCADLGVSPRTLERAVELSY